LNPKEYIESGILESYVLGASSPEESQEVECMARIFPEVRMELQSIQASLEVLAERNKVTPPTSLKAKIFNAIENGDEFSSAVNTAPGKVIDINKNSSAGKNYKMLAAASVALFLISLFAAVALYRKNVQLANSTNSIKNEQLLMQKEFGTLAEKYNLLHSELQALNDPALIPVPLKGVPSFPDARATVYWNKQSTEVLLAVNNLPEPPPGKQYQLWAIVNSVPVDLGVFNASAEGDSVLQKMKVVKEASAFAVTLEKTGGSSSPTLDQMYVIGNI
jgi:anti-sigma-K factor RskA